MAFRTTFNATLPVRTALSASVIAQDYDDDVDMEGSSSSADEVSAPESEDGSSIASKEERNEDIFDQIEEVAFISEEEVLATRSRIGTFINSIVRVLTNNRIGICLNYVDRAEKIGVELGLFKREAGDYVDGYYDYKYDEDSNGEDEYEARDPEQTIIASWNRYRKIEFVLEEMEEQLERKMNEPNLPVERAQLVQQLQRLRGYREDFVEHVAERREELVEVLTEVRVSKAEAATLKIVAKHREIHVRGEPVDDCSCEQCDGLREGGAEGGLVC